MMRIIIFFIIIMTFSPAFVCASSTDPVTLKVGVLSFRSYENTKKKWQTTIDHLSKTIPGYNFQLLPMNYTEINPAVQEKTIDFILTNTGHYIELETNEGIRRMVTLVKSKDGIALKEFGGVIFTRADRDDINSLTDLKGKEFLAVKKSSLGGFLVAWEQFLIHGINPFSDLASLTQNGLPQDNIVFKVLRGEADAGTVRTGVLENMESEGEVSLSDFKILNQKYTGGFPLIHSTKLYPEWPFSKLSHVEDELAEKVADALLTIEDDSPSAKAGRYLRWVEPLDYQSVHDLFTTLNTGPYKKFRSFTFTDVIKKYLFENVIAFLILLVAIAFLIRIVQLNTSLKKALSEVQTLQGFIPICSSCKKVKDDKGYWDQVEMYITKHSEAKFSHGYCPDCYKQETKKLRTVKEESNK
ncbi:phosphate/phosphite/phosphonate ABC transporter substrate-binding protein [Desulforhopalus sp. 52FAK]